MTNNLKKLVLNWQEYSIPQGTTYTAWENIEISSWVISANNSYIITESDMTKSTTKTYWVAPYNTSYYYTNYTINANSGIKWVEWAWYTFVIDTQTVASAYRNTRVRIWTGDYIPVMSSGWAILWWHSYFTKANSRCYQYSTRYESWWALHLMTDSNTTYSAMSTAEIDAWTGTTARLITPTNLKYAIENLSPSKVDDTAYANSWDWVTWVAPSKNAVYDKILSMDTTIWNKANTNDVILKSTSWTQTVSSTTTSQTTPLGVKSANANSAYISFSNANGWKWSYWVDNSWKPMYYNWTEYQLAYKTDIPSVSWFQTTSNLKTSLSDNSDSYYPSQKAVKTAVDGKQATLVSWTNIKTINWNSLLWSGDITISWWTDYSWTTKTISGGSVEIWLRTIVNQPSANFTITKPATLQDWEEYVIRIVNDASHTITLWTWITNPRWVNLSTSQYATDQFVFIAIDGILELQPLITIP